MDTRLLPDGNLVYSPICCTVRTKFKKAAPWHFETTNGKTRKATVKWLKNQSFSDESFSDPDFWVFLLKGTTCPENWKLCVRAKDEYSGAPKVPVRTGDGKPAGIFK